MVYRLPRKNVAKAALVAAEEADGIYKSKLSAGLSTHVTLLRLRGALSPSHTARQFLPFTRVHGYTLPPRHPPTVSPVCAACAGEGIRNFRTSHPATLLPCYPRDKAHALWELDHMLELLFRAHHWASFAFASAVLSFSTSAGVSFGGSTEIVSLSIFPVKLNGT